MDEDHCGRCGEECDSDQTCTAGSCVGECQAECDPGLELCVETQCLCRPGFTRCGSKCVDLEWDPSHCGGCPDSCSNVCVEGECADTCDEGEGTSCDGVCTDFESDPLHCGDCDTMCDADELCIDSECRDFVESNCDGDDDCGSEERCCEFLNSKVCLEGDQCP